MSEVEQWRLEKIKKFPVELERLIATAARMFAAQKARREVEILAAGQARVTLEEYDNWNGGTYFWGIHIDISPGLYAQISEVGVREAEANLGKVMGPFLDRFGENHCLRVVAVHPVLAEANDWREHAASWLQKGESNQGRVRSDNVAKREHDGLLFRSSAEINLYKALKARGVAFAPLPVFVRGGPTYRRLEPDFLIIKDGIVLQVEVDGDAFHPETPAEAHDRTTMLVHEGVHIERVTARDCESEDAARACAARLLTIIEKHAKNR